MEKSSKPQVSLSNPGELRFQLTDKAYLCAKSRDGSAKMPHRPMVAKVRGKEIGNQTVIPDNKAVYLAWDPAEDALIVGVEVSRSAALCRSTGCGKGVRCLSCSLPVCILDAPSLVHQISNQVRGHKVETLTKQGCSNKEIAEGLKVSERTVQRLRSQK